MNRYKTFKTKTGYCTVDTEAEIKDGDKFYNQVSQMIFDFEVGCESVLNKNDFKVIAAHPPLSGVATYCELPKDDVERCFTKEDIERAILYGFQTCNRGGNIHIKDYLATLSKQPDWQFEVEETFLNNANTDELKRSEFVPKIINNVLQGHWEAIPPTPFKNR